MAEPIVTHALGKAFGKVRALEDVSLQVPQGQVVGPDRVQRRRQVHAAQDPRQPAPAIVGPCRDPRSGLTVAATRRSSSRSDTWPKARACRPCVRSASSSTTAGPSTGPGTTPWRRGCWRRWICRQRHGVPRASRGERVKAALVATLAFHPQVLILDEPLEGLDPLTREQVVDGLLELVSAEGTTVLLASHDLDVLERLLDEVAMLHGSRLVFQERLDDLQERYRLVEVAGVAQGCGGSTSRALHRRPRDRRGHPVPCHALRRERRPRTPAGGVSGDRDPRYATGAARSLRRACAVAAWCQQHPRCSVTRIVHLIAHDLRTHRSLLLAWVLIVVLHPVPALLSSAVTEPAMLLWFGVLLVVARLTVGAIVLGVVFHADSPLDDRAFWRTRPIAPGEMAAAKLGLAALLFVLLPLFVVVGVAVAVGVPWSHWPSTVGQVLFTDAALAGLTMALATKTRSLPALVLAIIVSLIALYLVLFSALEARRMPAMAGWMSAGRLDPEVALPTLLVWASIGLWAVAAIGVAGRRLNRRFACIGRPDLHADAGRLVRAASASPREDLRRRINRGRHGPARRYSRRGTCWHQCASVSWPHRATTVWSPAIGYRRSCWMDESSRPGIDLAARGERDPRSVVPNASMPRVPLLAVLSHSDFSTLAGRPVRFTGRLNVDVQRANVVASAPLAEGAVLSADRSRLAIAGIFPASEDVPQRVAQGLTVETYVPGRSGARRREYRLRDARSGCVARLLPQSSPGTEIATLTLLPTLARPFAVRRGELVTLEASGCRPSPTASVVEMVDVLNLVRTVGVSVDFTMPDVADITRAPVGLPANSQER